MALTVITSPGIANNQGYVFGSANVTGNLIAGTVLTNSLLYANGAPYVTGGGGGGSTIYSRSSQIATANQNTFTVAYTTGAPLQVFINGVLLNGADYSATNGTTIVLTDVAVANDLIEFVTYSNTSISSLSMANVATINSTNLTSNLTVASGYSAMSVGPLSIASNVVISIASGQKWVIL